MDSFSQWQLVGLGVLTVISVLLVLGVVRPNRWFGISTARTRAHTDDWYKANRAVGFLLLSGAFAAIAITLLARFVHPAWGFLGVLATVAFVVAVVVVHRRYAA